MGCRPKGIKLGGCGCALMVWGRGEGGSKHEFETWHVLEGQVLGVLVRTWESTSMCHSNNVGASKVPRVGCIVICQIT
jgi:hypothetical protein